MRIPIFNYLVGLSPSYVCPGRTHTITLINLVYSESINLPHPSTDGATHSGPTLPSIRQHFILIAVEISLLDVYVGRRKSSKGLVERLLF